MEIWYGDFIFLGLAAVYFFVGSSKVVGVFSNIKKKRLCM